MAELGPTQIPKETMDCGLDAQAWNSPFPPDGAKALAEKRGGKTDSL